MKENRQSPRIVLRVPLEIRAIEAPCEATTAVVNQHGALILAPVPYPVSTTLDLRNMETHRSTPGRVVWSGDSNAHGDCKVGVAFKRPVTNFWGRITAPRSESRTVLSVGARVVRGCLGAGTCGGPMPPLSYMGEEESGQPHDMSSCHLDHATRRTGRRRHGGMH